jgi:septal ring factor EnvC (AmiA/AmiB activator)
MTLMGKIFTMLIFVMSVVFMAFSIMVFATHRNWRDTAAKLQTELNAAQTAKKDAEDQIAKLKTQLDQEQVARVHALAALTVRAVNAETQLAAKQQELDALSAQHTTAAQAAKTAQERLATLEGENQKLRDDLRAAQVDSSQNLVRVVQLTDKLNQLESVRQNLEERNKEATQQIAQMKTVLDRNGLRPDALVSHIPPKVDGVVLATSGRDLVEISIGADDGLKVGHSLDVYRDNQYLGRIKILKTDPDRAVGQMIRDLQRGQIKRGDRVTSKFS